MRIVTLNANGIRAAARKGLFEWLARARPWDVVCLQEIKASDEALTAELRRACNCTGHFFHSARAGYSGVAIYARRRPREILRGFGDAEFDGEGRYLEADFGSVRVVSVYLPSGSSSEARLQAKFRFLDRFLPHLQRLRASGQEYILCGDWNIAHREIDLKNWRGNRNNPGFLPQEREWLSRVFEEVGFIDVFRRVDERPEQYTWWSNRGQAWAKNVGWRIDYQIATPGIAARAKRATIYTRQRFSDHAPLMIEYDGRL